MTKRKKLSVGVRVLNIVVVILVLLSLVSVSLFIYFKYFNKDTTIGVNYIDKIIAVDSADNLTDKERQEKESKCFIEANLYSNDRNNGIELQELQINYFTDYRLTSSALRSSGMQYVGDVSKEDFSLNSGKVLGVKSDFTDENYISSKFDYYDTTNGITWNGVESGRGIGTKFNRQENFIISIDGEAYSLQLNKTKDYKMNVWFIELSKYTDYANWGELFQLVMNAIKSNDKGYGDYYITLDMTDFFTIKKYDKNTGKYLNDNVTDIIKNYAVLKFHYDSNGAINANQSMFGSIKCNNAYGFTKEDLEIEYWQERTVYTLDEGDLVARYSESDKGYYLSLSTENKLKIKSMNRIKFNVVININKDKQIVGLDYNAFKSVPIDSITLIGEGDFKLMEGCLIDTKFSVIWHSVKVNVIHMPNSTNNSHAVVTL